jgi:cytochrome c biogenesis protein CcmG/thiol:disulfide interchange protein DsbE
MTKRDASPLAAKKGSGTPVWVWLAVAAVVVVAAVVAVVITTSYSSDDLTSAEVTASGSVLPTFTGPGSPDPARGTPAPRLKGSTLAGDPVTIGGDGTPTVLVFLAHWCPVCQKEVPIITDWVAGGGDVDGVDVYSVVTSVDRTRGNYPPGSWLRRADWPFTSIVDDPSNTAANVFGLSAFPYYVAIDAEGNVVERVTGELDAAGFAALVGAARTGVPVTVESGAATPT